MNMKVIVVTHKITDLPFGGGYMPICVGPNKDSFPKNIQRDAIVLTVFKEPLVWEIKNQVFTKVKGMIK